MCRIVHFLYLHQNYYEISLQITNKVIVGKSLNSKIQTSIYVKQVKLGKNGYIEDIKIGT